MLSTQPLTWAGSLLTTALVPRLLGAEAFGQFTIATTIATLAGVACTLGISEYLVRRVAQSPATLRQDAGVGLLVQTITTVVVALIIGAVLAPLGVFSLFDLSLLYVAMLGMLITPAQTVLLSSFRGREMHRHYAWFNAAVMVIGQLIGILALVVGGGVLVYTAIIGLAAIGCTIVGWQMSGLRPALPSPLSVLLRQSGEFIWGGLPFLTSSLTIAVMSGIDRVLLSFFVPAAEVGWYAAAYRVFAIPLFIPTLIMNPLFPALSRSVHDPDTIRRTITKTLHVVLLLMVSLTAGVIVVAPAVPDLLGWPSDFSQAAPLMAVLSLQLPIIAVDMVLGTLLMAIGRQRPWVAVAVVCAVAKIGLDFLFIPLFESHTGNGAMGASIVSLVAELLMFCSAIVLIPKNLLDPRIAWDAVRIIVAGGVTVLIGATLLPLSLALAILGGAVAYLASAVLLRAVTSQDIRPITRRIQAVVARRG